MLVTNNDLLIPAHNHLYGIGHFNVYNLETLFAVSQGAEDEKSPVIVAVTPSSIKYTGLEFLALIIKKVANSIHIPISLHLDHGDNLEIVLKCIKAGFTSVMFDGSFLNFNQNVNITRQVVKLAHAKGISVEAELGRISGVEEVTIEEQDAILTNPISAYEFVKKTNVDSLAIAIGTSHGAYKFKKESKLDFKRLKLIRDQIDIPLVLHGASSVPQMLLNKANRFGADIGKAMGIQESQIKKAISLGISKINIDTDLRLAFTASIREFLANSPKEIDPRKIIGVGKEAMKEIVKQKIHLFGSSGKA
jgi:fructose-bisphosphate aldolase class II